MKERLIKEKSVKFSYAGLVSQRNVVQILEVGGKVRSKPRDPSMPLLAHWLMTNTFPRSAFQMVRWHSGLLALHLMLTNKLAGLEDLPNSKLSPSGSTDEWL